MESKFVLFVCGIIIGLIFGLIFGAMASDNYISKDSAEQLAYDMFNKGYNQCKYAWIDSLIGVKSNCYYEVNQNKTMQRYVCGQFASVWREI